MKKLSKKRWIPIIGYWFFYDFEEPFDTDNNTIQAIYHAFWTIVLTLVTIILIF